MKDEHRKKLEFLLKKNMATSKLMKEMKPMFDNIMNRKENGTAPRAITSFNLFQTPRNIIDMMIRSAGDLESKTILEPSAGAGRIYRAISEHRPKEITLCEISKDLCRELYGMSQDDDTVTLLQGDFLEKELNCNYDVIIMNPPFKNGTDIKHINHALRFLKPNGILVSLCYDGVKQNRNLKPNCESWTVLPSGSFKKEGTSADVALLTIRK